jgi:hypothetical protein
MGRISRMDFFEFGFFVKISFFVNLEKLPLGHFGGFLGYFG